MTWPGLGPSGYFWTLNTDGSIGRVDWEEAQGDASGVIDNLVVIALQGTPVSPNTPMVGNILEFDGTAWTPTTSAGVSGTHNLLSSTHLDTIPANVIAGDIIVGSGSPASWIRFPVGLSGQILATSNSLETEWSEPNVISPTIISTGASVNLVNTDRRVIVNKTVGSATIINMQTSPVAGQEVIIKDGKGDAGLPSTNQISIIPQGGATIDGLAQLIIGQNYGAYTLYWNGTEWNIV